MAILLETFQSLQRKGLRYLLLLTGLPPLVPKLVQSRTYAERMFTVQEIGKLNKTACKEAIEKPLEAYPLFKFTPSGVDLIIEQSGGYPYFIQFICREVFDFVKSYKESNPSGEVPQPPIDAIILKLDSDFFGGRWDRIPDRQRDLLFCISRLSHCDQEFTISEIVEASKGITTIRSFRYGDVSAMLPRLIDNGLIFKNRHGKYSFAVPLFGDFIRRQYP